MPLMKFYRFVFLRAIALALLIEPAIAADQVIALKAARLFDGKSRALIQDGVVLAQGDKITDVGANVAIPPGAQVIDLGDATLSPGFIDAHTHLTSDFSGNYNERRLKELDLTITELAYTYIAHDALRHQHRRDDAAEVD